MSHAFQCFRGISLAWSEKRIHACTNDQNLCTSAHIAANFLLWCKAGVINTLTYAACICIPQPEQTDHGNLESYKHVWLWRSVISIYIGKACLTLQHRGSSLIRQGDQSCHALNPHILMFSLALQLSPNLRKQTLSGAMLARSLVVNSRCRLSEHSTALHSQHWKFSAVRLWYVIENINTLTFQSKTGWPMRDVLDSWKTWKCAQISRLLPETGWLLLQPSVLQPHVCHSSKADSVLTTSSNIFQHQSVQMVLFCGGVQQGRCVM